MDLLRSIASSLAGGWSSRSRRGGSERGLFEGSSSSPSLTTMPSLPLQTALAPLQRQQQQQTTPPPLSPTRNSSSIIGSRNGIHHHHQSPHRAVNASPPRPLLLRRRPSALGLLDAAGQILPPPPSAPLPPEQVERYWRLQRRLAATLLPEVVRLEALCAEIAAAAAAEATAEAAARAGAGAGSSFSSGASSSSSSSSSSPRAGQDPHAATRIAALRRRTLVPLLARLRALPVSEAGGGGEATAAAAATSTPTTPSPSSSSPSAPSNTTVPTRADLAALRRAAAVLPRYLEQLRVATRGRPKAFDSERFCAAAAA